MYLERWPFRSSQSSLPALSFTAGAGFAYRTIMSVKNPNDKNGAPPDDALEAAAMAVNDALEELSEETGLGPDEILEAVQNLRQTDLPDRATTEQQAQTRQNPEGNAGESIQKLAEAIGMDTSDQPQPWQTREWVSNDG